MFRADVATPPFHLKMQVDSAQPTIDESSGHRKEVSSEEREEAYHLALAASPSAQPDAAILQTGLQLMVDDAIGQLPNAQRMAMILRQYEQLSDEEIANVLGLAVSAVKSLLFRARSSLRELLYC
jgi:RNA polymerase sigma-70 factor (ECF subfamily)